MNIKEEITNFGKVWMIEINDFSKFALYRYDDDLNTIYLSNIHVEDEAKGNGYGNDILQAAESIAKDKNAQCLCLRVLKDAWMHQWYNRHGFEDLQQDENEKEYIWMIKSL